jgi:Molecular chaperone (small heat shock protein)
MAQKEVSTKVIEEISNRILNSSSAKKSAPQKQASQQNAMPSMNGMDLDSINRIAKSTPPPTAAQMQEYSVPSGGDEDVGMLESAMFGGGSDASAPISIDGNPALAARAAAARARSRLNEQASYGGGGAEIYGSGINIDNMDDATKARLCGYDNMPQGLYIKGIGHVNNVAQNRKIAAEAAKQANASRQTQEAKQTGVQVQAKKTQIQLNAPDTNMPPYEMLMYDDRYEIYVDLPGVSPENLNVEYSNDGSLVVSGTRESYATGREPKDQATGKKKQKKAIQRISTVPKCQLGKFSFEFPLKKMVDETNIKAELDNGILHVTLLHRIKGEKVRIALM